MSKAAVALATGLFSAALLVGQAGAALAEPLPLDADPVDQIILTGPPAYYPPPAPSTGSSGNGSHAGSSTGS
ncbi:MULTISPECIES: hypothetical protein [unclassified Nocardia]|uniref:hypothetical protein n=1 Tax=unclassified Nocardia TaxID=2637762 RepID=UPI0035D95291